MGRHGGAAQQFSAMCGLISRYDLKVVFERVGGYVVLSSLPPFFIWLNLYCVFSIRRGCSWNGAFISSQMSIVLSYLSVICRRAMTASWPELRERPQ